MVSQMCEAEAGKSKGELNGSLQDVDVYIQDFPSIHIYIYTHII